MGRATAGDEGQEREENLLKEKEEAGEKGTRSPRQGHTGMEKNSRE